LNWSMKSVNDMSIKWLEKGEEGEEGGRQEEKLRGTIRVRRA